MAIYLWCDVNGIDSQGQSWRGRRIVKVDGHYIASQYAMNACCDAAVAGAQLRDLNLDQTFNMHFEITKYFPHHQKTYVFKWSGKATDAIPLVWEALLPTVKTGGPNNG
jgi:hypothetical protein